MTATFAKLNDGSWGIRVQGTVSPGDKVTVRKKDGSSDTKTVGKVVWSGNGVCLCSIGADATAAKSAATPAGGTSRYWRDVKVGSVIYKGGRRYGVVTEVDADGGFSTVKLDRAEALERDDDDYHGGASRRRQYAKTALIGRAGCEADAPLQHGYSVGV